MREQRWQTIGRKIKDPTEAALSAIQEALNPGDREAASNSSPAGEAEDLGASAAAGRTGRRRWATSSLRGRNRVEAQSAPNGEPAAANDDRQSVGQMLQLLQRGPSRRAYLAAALFSVAWVAAGLAIAIVAGGKSLTFGAQGIGLPAYGLLAAIALPVVFFFILAYMVRRTQELRIIAQTMAEAAIRLWSRSLARNRSSRWARRSATRWRPWAMALSVPSPARPSSRPWFTTK